MIGTQHSLANWVALAFDFSPIVPIAIAWVGVSRETQRLTRWTILPLVAVTASLFWLALSLISPAALGPTYSNVRFAIIDANFIAMMLAAIAAFSRMPKARVSTGIACALMGLIWSFIAAINVVV